MPSRSASALAVDSLVYSFVRMAGLLSIRPKALAPLGRHCFTVFSGNPPGLDPVTCGNPVCSHNGGNLPSRPPRNRRSDGHHEEGRVAPSMASS